MNDKNLWQILNIKPFAFKYFHRFFSSHHRTLGLQNFNSFYNSTNMNFPESASWEISIAKMGNWLYCFLITWTVRTREFHSYLTVPSIYFSFRRIGILEGSFLVTGRDTMLFLFKLAFTKKIPTEFNLTRMYSESHGFTFHEVKLKGQKCTQEKTLVFKIIIIIHKRNLFVI